MDNEMGLSEGLVIYTFYGRCSDSWAAVGNILYLTVIP